MSADAQGGERGLTIAERAVLRFMLAQPQALLCANPYRPRRAFWAACKALRQRGLLAGSLVKGIELTDDGRAFAVAASLDPDTPLPGA